MKNTIFILATLFMIIAFTSCDRSATAPGDPVAEVAPNKKKKKKRNKEEMGAKREKIKSALRQEGFKAGTPEELQQAIVTLLGEVGVELNADQTQAILDKSQGFDFSKTSTYEKGILVKDFWDEVLESSLTKEQQKLVPFINKKKKKKKKNRKEQKEKTTQQMAFKAKTPEELQQVMVTLIKGFDIELTEDQIQTITDKSQSFDFSKGDYERKINLKNFRDDVLESVLTQEQKDALPIVRKKNK